MMMTMKMIVMVTTFTYALMNFCVIDALIFCDCRKVDVIDDDNADVADARADDVCDNSCNKVDPRF